MTIGRVWKRQQSDTGPIATGYITVLGVDVRIALWKNQKRSEKDPDLTISVNTPKPPQAAPQVASQEFSDDIPF